MEFKKMIAELEEKDKSELLKITRAGGVRNLLFINNLKNCKIGEVIKVYKAGDFYIMNWRDTSLLLIKTGEDCPVEDIKKLLSSIKFKVVSGEKSALLPFEDLFSDDFEIKYNKLMSLDKSSFKKKDTSSYHLIELFGPEDWELLYDLYAKCPEYEDITDEDKDEWSLMKAEEEYPATGVVLMGKNEALAGAYLAGATKEMAIVVGVATLPDWRGGGLGSAAVSELCDIALNENNIEKLALTYSNDISKHIYEKLGFKEECEYAFFKRRTK